MKSTNKKDVNGITIYENDDVIYMSKEYKVLHSGTIKHKDDIFYIHNDDLYPIKLHSDLIDSIMIMKKIKT